MAASLRQQRESVAAQIASQRERQPVRSFALPPLAAPRAAVFPSRTFAPAANCPMLSPAQLAPAIDRAAEENDISPLLLRAVARAESGFVPCAVSSKGAAGLMQIMPFTGRELGLVDPFDPQQSLAAGAKYLSQLLVRYGGDLRLALSAYNAGPNRVDRYGDVPPINETQGYVRRILSELSTTPLVAGP